MKSDATIGIIDTHTLKEDNNNNLRCYQFENLKEGDVLVLYWSHNKLIGWVNNIAKKEIRINEMGKYYFCA